MEIELSFQKKLFNSLHFMKTRANMTIAVSPWHYRSKMRTTKGKIGSKILYTTFFVGKNKLLNKRKITNFEKVLNSWKVCWKRAFPVKQRVCVREFSMCQALIFWMKGISFPTGLNNKLFFFCLVTGLNSKLIIEFYLNFQCGQTFAFHYLQGKSVLSLLKELKENLRQKKWHTWKRFIST